MIEGPTNQGAVTRGYLPIPGLLRDGDLEVPYVKIQGGATGPQLTVLAGSTAVNMRPWLLCGSSLRRSTRRHLAGLSRRFPW